MFKSVEISMNFEEQLESPQRPEYKAVVEQIRALNWENLEEPELQQLMHLSYAAALEFAESLRIAQRLFPENPDLAQMIQGELDTDNLSFDDYNARGDHSAFLEHFLVKSGVGPDEAVSKSAEEYLQSCRTLSDEARAMSVFSREEELSGIFERILKAPSWNAPGLPAFRYFLSSHIELDMSSGGHHDLTKAFVLNDSIKPFYEARLKMYSAIPKLFQLPNNQKM